MYLIGCVLNRVCILSKLCFHLCFRIVYAIILKIVSISTKIYGIYYDLVEINSTNSIYSIPIIYIRYNLQSIYFRVSFP